MKTHWKKAFNKDYLGAHDIEEGKELLLTISHVDIKEVKNSSNTAEKRNVAYFTDGNVKPMILNVTACKQIAKFAKSKYIDDWINIDIQVFSKTVRAFGEDVEALRIKDYQPKAKKDELTPIHSKWNDAKKAIENGSATIDAIKKRFILSQENETELCKNLK